MAKKKSGSKKKAPDLSNRPLSFRGDLSKSEQKDAVALVSGLSETMPEQFAQMAYDLRNSTIPTQVSNRKRYERAQSVAEAKPVSLESMSQNRTDSFLRALTGPHRLPTEDYSGEKFYFKHRGEIDQIMSDVGSPDTTFHQVSGATSQLSVRNKPENEKASLRGLLSAHTHGTVHVNEDLLRALPRSGHHISKDHHNMTIPFSSLPHEVVGEMVSPDTRRKVTPHLSGVDLNEIGKTSMGKNIMQAHRELQGTETISPTGNPKLWAYRRAHELAVPKSPEEGEFDLRKMHIGKVARGEQPASQMMFDFYNLRKSNEGILSNQLAMPEDSWMNAISFDQPDEIKKAAGDVTLGKKTGTTRRGRELSVGEGVGSITPAAIQHSVNTEATNMAAQQIQDQLGLDFTVPAMMVQEGDWAETRRRLGKDAQYNAARRAEKEKKPKKPKSPPTLF